MTTLLFYGVVALALMFALTNGFINGGGLVSTVITTRAMTPLPALLVVAACEVLGLLLLGHAVSNTLAKDVVAFPAAVTGNETLALVVSALLGALSWNLMIWRLAFPSSTTHALMGGLAGAAVCGFGASSVHWPVFLRIILLLGFVPSLAFFLSYVSTRTLRWAGTFVSPSVGRVVRVFQVLVMAGSAMAHGSNDGQKTVGMIVLGAVALGGVKSVVPVMPFWAIMACGITLALGVVFGSRRTIKSVGQTLYRVDMIEGFSAGLSTMLLVGGSSLAGVPISSSHVMSTSVLGAGVAVHPRGVRWTLAGDIALAWFVTIPVAGVLAALWMGVMEFTHVVP